jgi:uncharacterized membrane protein YfcA
VIRGQRHHAARAEAADRASLDFASGITFGFLGGILGGMAAMSGPLVFIFLLTKGLRGKAFTKKVSLYLVVSSAGLLVILLTTSLQFHWFDVSVWLRPCPLCSACTSDNNCAIELHLRHSWC